MFLENKSMWKLPKHILKKTNTYFKASEIAIAYFLLY